MGEMNYRDLKAFGLYGCATCGAVVKGEDRGLHDDWHVAMSNHGHNYAAGYGGPADCWDVTTGPVPAKQLK